MAEPIGLGFLFSAGELALKLPELLGIVETIDQKIDRLSEAELESGYRLIEQASDSVKEREPLLRQAWIHLNKAISLEKELRLALAYLGLAFCQYHLGENGLAKESLEQILKLEIKWDTIHLTKKAVLGSAAIGAVGLTAGIPALFAVGVGAALLSGEKRKQLREKINQTVNNYIGPPSEEKLALLKDAAKQCLITMN